MLKYLSHSASENKRHGSNDCLAVSSIIPLKMTTIENVHLCSTFNTWWEIVLQERLLNCTLCRLGQVWSTSFIVQ